MSERAATTGCAPAPRRAILRGAAAHGVGADDGDREPRPVRPELRVERPKSIECVTLRLIRVDLLVMKWRAATAARIHLRR